MKKFIKLVSIVLTLLMLVGTMTALVSITAGAEEGEPIYLEKNKTATINGITYRFDTTNADEEESWARVNPDGSWDMNIRHGDMLWFPDVKLTDTSSVYAEVTNSQSAPNNYFTGLAYGVTGEDAYVSTNVAVLKTFQNDKVRLRVTGALRTSLTKISNGDYGNGGDKRAFDSNFAVNDAWNAVKGENGNWGGGKTVYFKVDQTADKVITEFGVPGIGAFTDSANTSYAKNLEGMYAIAGGSVGYTFVWGSDSHTQVRIDKLEVTNCTVAGVAQESYVIGKTTTDNEGTVLLPMTVTAGTDFAVNNFVIRFDRPEGHINGSKLQINADGTVTMTGARGDLFWIPNVELTANSVFTTVVNFDSAAAPGSCCAGTVYAINANGAWNEDADTAIVAALRTNGRRSIATTNYQKATVNADFVDVLTDVNYTVTNEDFGAT